MRPPARNWLPHSRSRRRSQENKELETFRQRQYLLLETLQPNKGTFSISHRSPLILSLGRTRRSHNLPPRAQTRYNRRPQRNRNNLPPTLQRPLPQNKFLHQHPSLRNNPTTTNESLLTNNLAPIEWDTTFPLRTRQHNIPKST